jgi:hypothetical protein
MATSRGETRKMIANLNATTHRLKFFVVPQKLMKTNAHSEYYQKEGEKGYTRTSAPECTDVTIFLHIPKNSVGPRLQSIYVCIGVNDKFAMN